MTLPGRKYSSGSKYRYGFNGKENDNSTGEGNLDFGARVYDNRLGRWLGVDPFEIKYPMCSPYTFASNNPIFNIDAGGKFVIPYAKGTDEYKAAISFINRIRTEVQSWRQADPKWEAFQALTGTASRADLLNVLVDGNGPEFNWGNSATPFDANTFLMRGNGAGFDQGSAYAITTGTSRITFDEGLMQVTLAADRAIAGLAESSTPGSEFKIGNSLGNLLVKGNTNIQNQINQANDFLVANGLHEIGHQQYNQNGASATLNANNSDRVIIPNTATNERLFGVGLFNPNTCGPVNMERGDAVEQAVFGRNLQYTNSGVIPLLIYNNKALQCNTGNGSATRDCQTQAQQTTNTNNLRRQQQTDTAAEPGVINF
jgi:RHS repeat-associated protein